MKIAFLLSGQPRMVDKAYDKILSTFLLPHNPDVFVHTWVNPEDYNKSIGNSWGNGSFSYSDDIVGNIYNKYFPVKYKIENQINFTLHPNHIYPTQHFNMVSMLYSMNEVNELKKQYEEENNFKYDCVIRYRFDLNLSLDQPIDLSTLDLDKSIYCLNHCVHYNGINDLFAIGNSQNMDVFNSSYKNVNEFAENYQNYADFLCGETTIYYSTWFKNQITLERLSYDYTLFR